MLTLPSCPEAERELVAGLLLDPEAFDDLGGLRPDDIQDRAALEVYKAARGLFDAGETVTLPAIFDRIKAAGRLDSIGGPAKISELAGYSVTSASVPYHARQVREAAIRRAVMKECAAIVKECQTTPEDFGEWLDSVQRRLSGLGDHGGNVQTWAPASDMAGPAFKEIEDAIAGAAPPGVKTGLAILDRATNGGFRPGQMVILAARPGVGKSALALQVALHAALGGGHRVALFSLEMSKSEVMRRALCHVSGVPMDHIAPGSDLERDGWQDLAAATERLWKAALVIDDDTGLSPFKLRSRARKIKRHLGGLDMIIVDYLQLLSADHRGERREREIAEASRALKCLAGEIGAPVVALSQLNRAPEAREGGRVRLSDLRESGAVEQDADLVASIYRPGILDPKTYRPSYAVLELLKQRSGPSGFQIELAFDGRRVLFRPWDGPRGGKK